MQRLHDQMGFSTSINCICLDIQLLMKILKHLPQTIFTNILWVLYKSFWNFNCFVTRHYWRDYDGKTVSVFDMRLLDKTLDFKTAQLLVRKIWNTTYPVFALWSSYIFIYSYIFHILYVRTYRISWDICLIVLLSLVLWIIIINRDVGSIIRRFPRTNS